jgi:hypothetical protein
MLFSWGYVYIEVAKASYFFGELFDGGFNEETGCC